MPGRKRGRGDSEGDDQVEIEEAGKESHITSVCCYGGVPKWEQKKALRWGVEVRSNIIRLMRPLIKKIKSFISLSWRLIAKFNYFLCRLL